METDRRLVPAWLWTLVAVGILGVVIALAVSDRRREPGPSLQFDVTPFAAVDPAKVNFRQTARFPVIVTKPAALARGRGGRMFVAGEDAVVAMDANGKETVRYAVKGTPDCLAEAPDGRIFLGMRDHVEAIDPKGAPVAAWPALDGQAWITALAADEQNLYMADAGNRVIWRFDHAGAMLNKIGERRPGDADAGFVIPSPYFDVLLDPSGALWAVNPGKHGFENYRPNGELISSWYRPGINTEGFCGCCNPIHAAYRSDGSVVTMEKGLNRIKVYTPDAKLLGVVATADMLGAPADAATSCQLETPVPDIAVDDQDRIWVLHGPWQAVLVYEQEKDREVSPR
ncbi:MAG TPA: hypothetical protein PKO36_00740 [Candidatus Hydrogenedentes bacterium]|nr:hypothetical protein [Candidatus Hydrogenedentota bacterium]